jgi:hypothetical protein
MPIDYITDSGSAFHIPERRMTSRNYAMFYNACLSGNILDAVTIYQTKYIDITFNFHHIWRTMLSIMHGMPYIPEYTAYHKLLCWFASLHPKIYQVTSRTRINNGIPTTMVDYTIKNKPTHLLPLARAIEDRDDALIVSGLLSLR